MLRSVVIALVVLGGLVANSTGAQPTLDDIRGQLRESLAESQFAKSFATQIIMSDELELSGAVFDIDDDENTTLGLLSLPIRRAFPVFAEGWPKLYLEGALGYAQASEDIGDFYDGDLPGFETTVDAEWVTASALGGIGVEFEPIERLKLTPIVNIGAAYIESRADYGGPGADVTRAIADGIGLNWGAWVASLGVAGRAEWSSPLEGEMEFTAVGRYDIRWAETVESEDDAQNFSSTSQFATLRTDLTGPTGWDFGGGQVRWRTTASFRAFTQGDLYGVSEYVQLGGGVELNDTLPIARRVSLSAGVILGDNVSGYNFGFALTF